MCIKQIKRKEVENAACCCCCCVESTHRGSDGRSKAGAAAGGWGPGVKKASTPRCDFPQSRYLGWTLASWKVAEEELGLPVLIFFLYENWTAVKRAREI